MLQSIITRLRIIVTNFRNILLQLVWLIGVFILTSLTFLQPESFFWSSTLAFLINGRGFMDLICWFWVNSDSSRSVRRKARNGFFRRSTSTSAASADINVNKSLQKEMTVSADNFLVLQEYNCLVGDISWRLSFCTIDNNVCEFYFWLPLFITLPLKSYLGRGLRRSSRPVDFHDPEISKVTSFKSIKSTTKI